MDKKNVKDRKKNEKRREYLLVAKSLLTMGISKPISSTRKKKHTIIIINQVI
jgi:hypothetical protein